MRLSDLTREDEADTRSFRLRREERHEEVRALGQTRPFVFDDDLHSILADPPADPYIATGGERRIDRVAHDVDQQLIELISICANHRSRTLEHIDRESRLERRDAPNPFADF